METLLDLLKYLIPSLVVFFTAWLILKSFFDHENRKKLLDNKVEAQKAVIPVRLQAYERLVLFLERISPNQLIIRMNQPGITAVQFQGLLVQSIREEFEHNLSQQLYVSSAAWELVKGAKEETIRAINLVAATLPENAAGNNLAQAVLERMITQEIAGIPRALEFLKKEAREMF